MSVPLKAAALAFLEQNPLDNIDLLVPIRRGSAALIAANPRGVLLLERQSGAHMLTVSDPRYIEEFLDQIRDPHLMTVHGDLLAREAARRFDLFTFLCCNQAVWPQAAPPPISEFDGSIEALGPEWIDEVCAAYSYDFGADHLRGRILAGELFGALRDGRLMGFAGLHEEGSMGMLEVLPAFRRFGIASALGAYLCRWLMARGLTPFSQFTLDNAASRGLHEKAGFSIRPEPIYWLEERVHA